DQYRNYFHLLNPPETELPATGPVTGLASMMGKRNNPQFFASDVVNDAVGKSAQREAAPASPRRAKPWIRAQKLQGALEFSHEHKTQVGVFCLSCVVDSSVGEFPVQRPARPMASFNRGTRAGNGISGRHERR